MIVMILENVSTALRGELTRWLIEPHSGVFVGHVNAMVRERLWEKCCKVTGSTGGVVQIWSTNTEQRFAMRLHGTTQRTIVESYPHTRGGEPTVANSLACAGRYPHTRGGEPRFAGLPLPSRSLSPHAWG